MLKPILTAGAIALATAAPLAAFEIGSMSDEERAAFRAEVRAYLLDNPEVLMEAIQVLEQRQANEQAANDANILQVNAKEIFEDPNSWVGGNPEGDFTLVEFLDYRCGYCRKAHPEVAELVKSDGNIRYIVKEFPILGEESLLGSRFALGVRAVEGDDAYHTVMNTLMNLRGSITEQRLSELSEDMGFDTKAVFEAMNAPEVQQTILNNRALAQRLSISGTPSFVFDSEMVRGYVPLETMREIVEGLRADG